MVIKGVIILFMLGFSIKICTRNLLYRRGRPPKALAQKYAAERQALAIQRAAERKIKWGLPDEVGKDKVNRKGQNGTGVKEEVVEPVKEEMVIVAGVPVGKLETITKEDDETPPQSVEATPVPTSEPILRSTDASSLDQNTGVEEDLNKRNVWNKEIVSDKEQITSKQPNELSQQPNELSQQPIVQPYGNTNEQPPAQLIETPLYTTPNLNGETEIQKMQIVKSQPVADSKTIHQETVVDELPPVTVDGHSKVRMDVEIPSEPV